MLIRYFFLSVKTCCHLNAECSVPLRQRVPCLSSTHLYGNDLITSISTVSVSIIYSQLFVQLQKSVLVSSGHDMIPSSLYCHFSAGLHHLCHSFFLLQFPMSPLKQNLSLLFVSVKASSKDKSVIASNSVQVSNMCPVCGLYRFQFCCSSIDSAQ